MQGLPRTLKPKERPALDRGLAYATARVSGACRSLAPAQGVSAAPCRAYALFPAMQIGVPASTTQMNRGANVDVIARRRVSAVRWGVAGAIVAGWIVTLPAARIMASAFYSLGFWIK